MKNKKLIIVLGLIAVVLVCCTVNKNATGNKSKSSLVPDSVDFAIANTKWVGITLLNLNQGYSIFNDKCTECHGIKKPQDFTVQEWSNILPAMGQKARLDSNQYKLVYHYILSKREAILTGKK